jgi:hypothetical protein
LECYKRRTADVDGVLVSFCDFRIEIDQQVSVLRKFIIAQFYVLGHPLLELILHDRECHVCNECSRETMVITRRRKEESNLRVIASLRQDLFNAQTFVLRDVDHLDIFCFDVYEAGYNQREYLRFFLPSVSSLRK